MTCHHPRTWMASATLEHCPDCHRIRQWFACGSYTYPITKWRAA